MKSKGQAAVEVLVVLGILLLMFLGVFALYNAKRADVYRSEDILQERADCLQLTNAFMHIFTLGDSAEITISIQHNVTVEPDAQRIATEHSFCTYPVKAVYQSSSMLPDPFILAAGDVKVENRDGFVIVINV